MGTQEDMKSTNKGVPVVTGAFGTITTRYKVFLADLEIHVPL